jgi:hypothetical protein
MEKFLWLAMVCLTRSTQPNSTVKPSYNQWHLCHTRRLGNYWKKTCLEGTTKVEVAMEGDPLMKM